jgi:serine/threonine protein kinase
MASVVAKGTVRLIAVERFHLIQILGERIYTFINGIRASHGRDPLYEKRRKEEEEAAAALAAQSASIKEALVMKDSKYYKEIPLSELKPKAVLGKGAFGNVKLVVHGKSNESYALKCLSKKEIVENEVEYHVLDEKKIMLMLDHTFIVKLHNTYQDKSQLYLLLEVALGGELLQIMDRQPEGFFKEDAVRFYAASLVEVFKHLHEQRIAYRDLKPENLLLDATGYLKMCDFGLAKVVPQRTFTLCGTPEYMAPEMILGKGHDTAVDYWSLGVLIYELCAGK